MRIAKVISQQNKLLVFNLDWLSLLGDSTRVARQARSLRAGHYVVSGKPAAAVGLAYGLKNKKYWSAAELFASQHPAGTCACLLELEPNNWHLLASHEGVALVHADRSYTDLDLAQQQIANLHKTYPNIKLIQVDDKNRFLSELVKVCSQSLPLKKVRYFFIVYFLILSMLLLIWIFYPPTSNSVAAVDNQHPQAWTDALEKFIANNRLHGVKGTAAILNNINRQPVLIAGWKLASMQCVASPLESLWLCSSDYRRLELSADNQGLIKAAHKGWRLDFPSLDLAKVRWSVSLPSTTMIVASLPTTSSIENQWSSELQSILPAFTNLRLAAPKKINIGIGTGSGVSSSTGSGYSSKPASISGSVLDPNSSVAASKPADFPDIAVRKLSVAGPLRSAVLLKKLAFATRWQKAVIKYSPGIKSSSKSSSLTLQLEGVVYERRSS